MLIDRARRRTPLMLPIWIVCAAALVLSATRAPIASAQARQQSPGAPRWPSESPPRPLPARGVNFPPYEIKTLANGLQVVVVQHHEQPAVSLRLLLRAGAAQDPKGKAGLASLALALLDQGTSTRSAAQIADEIDSIGGGLQAGAGTDLSFATVVVMKDSLQAGLDLLSDVVRNPAFTPIEIERQRQQVLSGQQVSLEDPDYIADVVFDRLVYGFHPYGQPGSGTPESLQSMTPEDLRAFHQRFFAPNNAVVAVVGDVTSEEAFAGIEKAFGAWARRDIPAESFPDPPPPTRRVIVIDKPDAVQTEIRVGHIGLPRRTPDYMAINLAVRILGGEGANRLHRVLRTERALTYGAAADMENYKRSGHFVAKTDTRSERTAEALRLVIDEFGKLLRERVYEGELTDAQAYMAGSFPLTIETPDAIATQVLNALFYELDLDELKTFRERVNAVTVNDVQRVAREYLKPDRLSIVLVGAASGFVNQLKGIGLQDIEIVPIAALDLNAVDFRKTTAATPARR